MLARDIIQRVREIQIRTGRQVADVLAGEYTSVFKGRGIEFDEVRPYLVGDDVRTIDWNVTARYGAPFVKRYVEERQLTILIVADVSASQDFGSGARSKRETAAELCALLAFSANLNDDKVGLVLFHGGIEQYIPPRKGQRHALRVVREVLAHGLDAPGGAPPRVRRGRSWLGGHAARRPRSARQATNIAGALEFVRRVARRKTICFVVSDFLDEGYLKAMESANRKHDVIAVHLVDPRERALPAAGLVHLRDAETGASALVDTHSKTWRARYAARATTRVDTLRRSFQTAGIDTITIDPSASVVDPLVRFFHQRERRRRR